MARNLSTRTATELLFLLDELAQGQFNALNAVAAFAVARRLGMSEDPIAARLSSFVPPTMRMEHRRVNALEWEEKLDFQKVEFERLQLVEIMAKKLSNERLSDLVQQRRGPRKG